MGSMASLNLIVSGVPGSTSEPSVMAAPPAPLTVVMRGTMFVVKVQRLPGMRRWLKSEIGLSVTV